ncbi:MAG: AtpZ/AtpI family protein [Acidimicrobiia bacterium]
MNDFTSEERRGQHPDSPHQVVAGAVQEGWVTGGGFFASVMSGFLLGYLADRWLGTDPWLVVTGIIAGSISGFYQLYDYAKRSDDRGR